MTAGFLFVVVLFALLGHGYVWVAIVNRIHGYYGPRWLIDGTTNVCFACFLAIPLWAGFAAGDLQLTHFGGPFTPTALLGSYVQLVALWGAIKFILVWRKDPERDPPDTLHDWQQERLKPEGLDTAELPLGTFAKLLYRVPGNQLFELSIDRKRLAIPRLPEELQGWTIAHISDLHITGRIDAPWYERVIDEVNRLGADVVLVTGDLIENEACRPWLANSLGRLTAEHGIYFVLGNHDYYIDGAATRQALTDFGWHYVGAKLHHAVWRGRPVILGGNELPWSLPATMFPPREDSQTSSPLRILLSHCPDQFPWAVDQQIDLMVAGHTHGGQIRFPVLGEVASPSIYGTKYACGVFRRDHTVMHVTRGILGKTPLRWNCPPEIALLELTQPDEC